VEKDIEALIAQNEAQNAQRKIDTIFVPIKGEHAPIVTNFVKLNMNTFEFVVGEEISLKFAENGISVQGPAFMVPIAKQILEEELKKTADKV